MLALRTVLSCALFELINADFAALTLDLDRIGAAQYRAALCLALHFTIVALACFAWSIVIPFSMLEFFTVDHAGLKRLVTWALLAALTWHGDGVATVW